MEKHLWQDIPSAEIAGSLHMQCIMVKMFTRTSNHAAFRK